jgi:glutathione S-transferase
VIPAAGRAKIDGKTSEEASMLELYHGGHTTCSRKARLCLREKALPYRSHFLNLRAFEQHAPEYVALNPNGVVPTLIDDGQPIVDSMLINEYLDEKYPSPSLRPATPLGKARMRVWTKLASDHGLAGVVPRIWPAFKAHTDKLSPSELGEAIARVPLKERRDRWTKAAHAGFTQHDTESGREAAVLIVSRMEAGFGSGPWLMGEQYTLADIDLVPFIDRFADFYPDILNQTATPKTAAWLARMRERPAVAAVFATDEAGGTKAA